MKTNYNFFKTIVVVLLFSSTSWSQTTIAQWNFNGSSATTVPGGETSPSTSLGNGTALLVGSTTGSATFPAGISAAGIGSSDPVNTTPQTNFAWGTTNYPALGTGNKQNGIQINANTTGYADITFRFDQRLSNKTANTYVVQYTTNRTVATPIWVDAQLFTFTPAATGTGDVWYNLRTVDLTSISALDNNPNVAFRIVSDFDPSTGNYLASTSTSAYDPTGVVRFDMITVSAATTLGINEFETSNNKFKIYPNPSNKEIVFFNQTVDITVINTLGKVILNSKNTNSIDTRSFTSGIYFVKTSTGITTKLVIK